FEWSFLLDALQTERDQGITIDTSQIRLRTPARDIVLIDAPGHAEFLRNMMDRVAFDAGKFREIETEIAAHLAGLGLTPSAIIPISARNGDGVARHTPATAWYRGPTVLAALDAFVPAHQP